MGRLGFTPYISSEQVYFQVNGHQRFLSSCFKQQENDVIQDFLPPSKTSFSMCVQSFFFFLFFFFWHSGYLYYIDGYKKWNRSSQTSVIDIKTTALKNAIEWHRNRSEHQSNFFKLQKITLLLYDLIKLFKSWQLITSLKIFGGLINYFKQSLMII